MGEFLVILSSGRPIWVTRNDNLEMRRLVGHRRQRI